ncbi:MAG: 3-isopropylmalate dehydratase small subunit [Gammaproteobacteria bacterium]|nr:3-isopropylmalate dehydratase small subunit [Gammaproteobacteria bacterium]
MQPFTQCTGIVVPIDRPNVDTDAIIPKQFLKSIKRSGFGPNLFDTWRYLDEGVAGADCSSRPLNPEFVLNQPRYRGASILLGRDNFGCGSSREHAPWALLDFGIRVVVAPSFADIFYNNSAKNGLLLVTLDAAVIDGLFRAVLASPGYQLAIDLATQTVTTPTGEAHQFAIDAAIKHRLLNGLDDIGLTLQDAELIRAFESERQRVAPWLFC